MFNKNRKRAVAEFNNNLREPLETFETLQAKRLVKEILHKENSYFQVSADSPGRTRIWTENSETFKKFRDACKTDKITLLTAFQGKEKLQKRINDQIRIQHLINGMVEVGASIHSGNSPIQRSRALKTETENQTHRNSILNTKVHILIGNIPEEAVRRDSENESHVMCVIPNQDPKDMRRDLLIHIGEIEREENAKQRSLSPLIARIMHAPPVDSQNDALRWKNNDSISADGSSQDHLGNQSEEHETMDSMVSSSEVNIMTSPRAGPSRPLSRGPR